jgi:hypothetical protein
MNSRRLMCAPQAEDSSLPPTIIVEKTALCITAFWPTRLPQRVIGRLLRPGSVGFSSSSVSRPYRRGAVGGLSKCQLLPCAPVLGAGLAPTGSHQLAWRTHSIASSAPRSATRPTISVQNNLQQEARMLTSGSLLPAGISKEPASMAMPMFLPFPISDARTLAWLLHKHFHAYMRVVAGKASMQPPPPYQSD